MKKKFETFLKIIFIAGLVMISTTNCNKGEDTEDIVDSYQSGSVIDIDGNFYNTVKIGSQVWMVENLNTTRYRNGDKIPNITDNIQWSDIDNKGQTGAYCNYYNNESIGGKYGKLYNWYAVNDKRNIAPEGFHVASYAEWKILIEYVTVKFVNYGAVAKALASDKDWAPSDGNAVVGNELSKNNASGFYALPGGYRNYVGGFVKKGYFGFWWTSTRGSYFANSIRMMNNDYKLWENESQLEEGLSIRCIMDN